MDEITGILLAAGNSRRFGSNKLLTQVDNQALILYAAQSLSPCDRVIAVVREGDHELQKLLHEHGIEPVINEHADDGIGSSIARGVKASESSAGWCILPADMPFIKKSTTVEIVEALMEGNDIVAPHYKNQRGHPVGFSSRFKDQLLALDEDVGARDIITENQDKLLLVDVYDEGVTIDIDTPEELQLLVMHGSRIS
jgi:molybdenum cofactor cytidylyltransferase